jgi:Helix-turn-helix domain
MDDEVGAAGAGPAERAHHAGADGPAPERRRRRSAGRKRDAVLRLLRGEALELLSRELGVAAAELSGWRDAFLAGGAASLKTRPGGCARRRDRPPAGHGRRADHGQRSIGVGAPIDLGARIERLEGGRPLARRRSRR